MRFQSSFLGGRRIVAAFTLASLLLAATAHAEFLRVTAANSTGNSLYDVTSFSPPPGTINPLNTDGSSHGSFRALVLVPNQVSGTVDVLVADATNGQIIRYTPQLGVTPASETLVWKISSGNGPAHPDGLSVDAAGNLYIVTSKLNDSTTNAVWVLPVNSGSPTGYAAQPLLIDGTFASANGVKQLQETVVATTTTAAWGAGDLLVLVGNGSSSNSQNNSNDADVFVYSANTVSSVLNGGGPHTQPDHIIIGPNQFPAGEFPTGMDFYPPDGLVSHPTLLIATTGGRILRFDFTVGNGGVVVPSIAQVFASGLGSSLNKLKVALQLGVGNAFVTEGPVGKGSTGQILEFGPPTNAGNNLIGSVSGKGINNPDGLAVSTLNAVQATACTAQSGCDLSEGVDPHNLSAPTQPSGNVIEGSCVVLSDPRVKNGVCDGTPLAVSSVCPGFGNEVIPGSLCGGSGASHAGFALIRDLAKGVDVIPGLLNSTQVFPDEILPRTDGTLNPPCPSAVIAWAPRADAGSNEGTIVEVDQNGNPQLIDLTGFCDTSGANPRGLSIYGVGLTLNVSALSGGFTAYAQTKYNNLATTVTRANILSGTKSTLLTSLGQINTYLAQGNYACAANAVVTSDTLVANDPNPAADYPGDGTSQNPLNPNPWGEIRGRLANLYMILNYWVLNQTANAQWPPAAGTLPVCQAPARVTAANTVGNSVYDVTSFGPPGTTAALNTDGASHGSFHALALVPNQATGTVDVLAADATLGQIIRYTPAAGGNPATEKVVWSYSGSGPAHPDGLSADAAGNLYIVTSKLNDSTTNAVWVLPASPGSATGYVGQPLLIDGTFATANGVKVLQETVIATTATAAWGAGDLLVLVGNNSSSNSQNNTNDADVFVYKAANVAKVLNLTGPLSAPDVIILNPKQFPSGEYPVGMDFWPADALVAHPTLLIATTAGRVLRYDFSVSGKTLTPTMQVFASGLGSGLNKLKVTTELGVPYAFLTQASGTGQILQLGAPTSAGNTLIGSVTTGVNSPDGLAVTH